MTPEPYLAAAHDGAAAFLERGQPFLMEAEAENNLLLGLALELRAAPRPDVTDPQAPWLVTVEDGWSRVVGAAFRTPPHKIGLTRMPVGAARAVATLAAGRWTSIPGFLGTESVALAAAEAWSERHGGRPEVGMRQRIHRLDTVLPPTGVEGRMRRARREDLPLALTWGEGFARDAGAHFRPPEAAVESWIEAGTFWLWESGAEAVSMAIARGATPNGIRVGYVYTPPERRGSGYASALVAALSQRMLDEGRGFCVLYTDLSNPTSNAIYARVGYRPLLDVIDVEVR